MLLIFAVSVIAVSVALVVYLYQKRYANMVHYASQFAGPRAYPLVGNAGCFIGKKPTEFLQELHNLIRKWGKCFRFWMAWDLSIFVSDAKIAEVILSGTKHLDKSDEYRSLRSWFGDGLLTSNGRKWHPRRKILTPTFHFNVLERFAEIFDRQSAIFVEQLKSAVGDDGSVADIVPFVKLLALDVICESAMGTTVDAQTNSSSEYVHAVEQMGVVVIQRLFNAFARFDFSFRFTKYFRMQETALKVLHGYTDSVIHSRRQELARYSGTNQQSHQDDDIGLRKKVACLDMLLEATIDGQPLTDLEIREEVDIFMFAGHDTTTSATSFVLSSLAKHPDVQQKAYDEICSVIGNDPCRPVTLSMLNQLHYLEMIVKETLRLYPPVPIFGRKMLDNQDINGMTFPAGANVVFVPYAMGRDPDYFESPLEFRPERFAEETTAEKSNPYRYVPFSAGPRNCIGQKFAMAEIKSAVSKTLRHYELLLLPESFSETHKSLYFGMTLRVEGGLPLRCKKRV